MIPILDLSGVSKSFVRATILRDVDLTVQEGDFVSIIGYSGSGKSTLIKLIVGLGNAMHKFPRDLEIRNHLLTYLNERSHIRPSRGAALLVH